MKFSYIGALNRQSTTVCGSYQLGGADHTDIADLSKVKMMRCHDKMRKMLIQIL